MNNLVVICLVSVGTTVVAFQNCSGSFAVSGLASNAISSSSVTTPTVQIPSVTSVTAVATPTATPSPAATPFAALNTWTLLTSTNQISPRAQAATGWTGTEMVVWGGQLNSVPVNTGGFFNNITKKWRPMTTVGAPSPRFNATLVYVSGKIVIYGGANGITTDDDLGDGGVYDIASDTWSSMAPPPLSQRSYFAAFAYNGNVVGFAGQSGANEVYDGAIYNVAANTWTYLPTNGQYGKPGGIVLLGSKLYTFFNSGSAYYDLSTSAWTSIANPTIGFTHEALTVGSKILLGNQLYDSATNTFVTLSLGAVSPSLFLTFIDPFALDPTRVLVLGLSDPNQAGIYDSITNTTQQLGAVTNPPPHNGIVTGASDVWTGYSALRYIGYLDGTTYPDVWEYR